MRIALAGLLLLVASSVCAHDGQDHGGRFWTTDWRVLVPLAVSAGLYTVGLLRLWRRVGVGRGVRLWQACSFALGWVLTAGALVSPLHWLGERLFTAHMTEHEILIALAAPALVVARPIGGMMWGLPARWRPVIGGWGRIRWVSRVQRALLHPPVATFLHGTALWLWHAPALYDAALANPLAHWLQHLSFFGTALLFWWSLLQGRARERGYGAAVLYLFITALHSGFLGILLAVAREPLYPAQTSEASHWGLTPLEDQQLAGLIMWVPAGLVYAVAALTLAGLWIRHSGMAARRGETHALAR
jgi:cytochrome c oxidase assembly factor CtaG